MKKFLATVLLAGAFVTSVCAADAPAQLTRFTVDVDYTTAAFGAVNSELNKGTNVTVFGGGVAGYANLDLALLPILLVGVRGGYMYCMPAAADYLFGAFKETDNASLVPLEVGVSVNLELPSMPVSVMAGVYGGYGLANASYKIDNTVLAQTYTQAYSGQSVIGEILAAFNFKLSPGMSLNINGGYRVAKIAKMTLNEDVNYTILGIPVSAGKKGDVSKDSNGNNMEYDFSGLNIGAGISMGF